jgi:purine nucleoside phosphorylase
MRPLANTIAWANVDGTRHVLTAAAETGSERIVCTSTVGALAIPTDGTPGDEASPVGVEDMVGPYEASTFLAERGRVGQKYVLGNRNVDLGEIFRALAAIQRNAISAIACPSRKRRGETGGSAGLFQGPRS